jgi:glycosyltransferase involved in cell wall biosynthesis
MTIADVSVIVPCYDAERYLGAALESACAQVPAPKEVVVIDDGSTDGSAALAEGFGGLVRCVRQSHRGIGAARNAGLAEARGALIAFLDADDLWTPGSLACRLDLLAADAAVDCASGLTSAFISPELPEETRRRLHCPPGTSRGRGAGAMLLRRAIVEHVGSFDETLAVGETIDWVARADAAGMKTVTASQITLLRRIHDASTGTRERDHRADYLQVLKRSLDRRRAAAARTDPAPPDLE